jgi:hypothetical protein
VEDSFTASRAEDGEIVVFAVATAVSHTILEAYGELCASRGVITGPRWIQRLHPKCRNGDSMLAGA